MVILIIYKPDYTLPGLGIVLLGIPVFFLWRKYNKNPGTGISDETEA
jgi:APA family basic amino acid/polyamine antiporter